MPINRSRQDVEDYVNNALEEGYWKALLHQGEYAKSIDGESNSSSDIDKSNSSTNALSMPSPKTDINQDDWEAVAKIQDNDETILLEIVGFNRGGLLVKWKSLQGFVPTSQLLLTSTDDSYHERKVVLENYVGKSLNLRVIELSVENNRLIFSERAAQVESGIRSQTLHKLTVNTVVEGHVTNLCNFGAFIDLGGIEGLIHISELGWGRVAHPADMLQIDQKVKVYILEINEAKERIALSLKRLHDDPWETAQTRYKVGEVVEGRITNIVDFGAFACIEEGLEGLIHFSELAEGQFLHPRNVVSENDIVKARILNINSKSRRMGLSLRHI
jgi:small subunit ribosomal protein S1